MTFCSFLIRKQIPCHVQKYAILTFFVHLHPEVLVLLNEVDIFYFALLLNTQNILLPLLQIYT
jgi:hypothetical protein